MKYLWIMVLVASLGLIGCASKSSSCEGRGHSASSADAKAGKSACKYKGGTCSNDCKTMHAEGTKEACSHEGPCTEECKANHMKMKKAAHNHEGPCTEECKANHMKMKKAAHSHEGPCTDACKVPAGEQKAHDHEGPCTEACETSTEVKG